MTQRKPKPCRCPRLAFPHRRTLLCCTAFCVCCAAQQARDDAKHLRDSDNAARGRDLRAMINERR